MSFYEDTVAPVARYDDQYRGELIPTLEAYLGNDCNMNATARAIYAHRHTVAYRLERVKELTGLDPAATEDRERLGLGLKALRIVEPRPAVIGDGPRSAIIGPRSKSRLAADHAGAGLRRPRSLIRDDITVRLAGESGEGVISERRHPHHGRRAHRILGADLPHVSRRDQGRALHVPGARRRRCPCARRATRSTS